MLNVSSCKVHLLFHQSHLSLVHKHFIIIVKCANYEDYWWVKINNRYRTKACAITIIIAIIITYYSCLSAATLLKEASSFSPKEIYAMWIPVWLWSTPLPIAKRIAFTSSHLFHFHWLCLHASSKQLLLNLEIMTIDYF